MRNTRSPVTAIRVSVVWRIVLAAVSLPTVLSGCIDPTPTDCGLDVFVVTLPDDVLTGSCNSQCTLRDAVMAANQCPGPEIIELTEDTYVLSLRGSGEDVADVRDSRWGDLDILGDVTIRGISRGSVIEGDSTWQHRLMDIADGHNVILESLVLNGGNHANGGGIRNAGNLSIDNTSISENRSTAGGGVYNTGNLTLSRSELRNNNTSVSGGAVYNRGRLVTNNTVFELNRAGNIHEECGGAITNRGSMILENTIFSRNNSVRGGAICQNLGSAEMTLNHTRFVANTAPNGDGGAIYVWDSASAPRISDPAGVSIDNSTFLGNQAFRGGAISLSYQNMDINNSLFQNNRYSNTAFELSRGGAIFTGERSKTRIGESAFLDNSSDMGGAIAFKGGNFVSASGPAVNEIKNVTFTGNRGATNGGAIHTTSRVDITWSTFYANSGGTGFDLFTERRRPGDDPRFGVTFSNNIFAGSSGFICLLGGLSIVSNGNNVIEAPGGCSRAASSDRVGVSAGLVTPIDTSDNPPVFKLTSDSPARNSGDNSTCPGTDQVGNSRPERIDGICDIGAYESPD